MEYTTQKSIQPNDILSALDNIFFEIELCSDDCHNSQNWNDVSDWRDGKTYWDRINERIEEAKNMFQYYSTIEKSS